MKNEKFIKYLSWTATIMSIMMYVSYIPPNFEQSLWFKRKSRAAPSCRYKLRLVGHLWFDQRKS